METKTFLQRLKLAFLLIFNPILYRMRYCHHLEEVKEKERTKLHEVFQGKFDDLLQSHINNINGVAHPHFMEKMEKKSVVYIPTHEYMSPMANTGTTIKENTLTHNKVYSYIFTQEFVHHAIVKQDIENIAARQIAEVLIKEGYLHTMLENHHIVYYINTFKQ